MRRRFAVPLAVALTLSMISSGAALAAPPTFEPGAAGLGDPYFPEDGNGGYDVQHYLLDVAYDPTSDTLTGTATITAKATQNLSQFNLDLDDAMRVEAVYVDGALAAFDQTERELVVTPAAGIRNNTRFTVVVVYAGVPETLGDGSGFLHTDDGALVIGQPHVAATWFPANDHPSDAAAFTFRITVPDGLEAVANGSFAGQSSSGGWTTWVWDAPDPMAPYLAGLSIGELEISEYRVGKVAYWDAIDPVLLVREGPIDGTQFAISGQADSSYKRLMRTLTIPEEGATLTFSALRDTEPNWDFFFVEVRPAGTDEWTTLPVEGITSQDTGGPCPFWLGIHPFLTHYQTPVEPPSEEAPPCLPEGTSGEWNAVSGTSGGWEGWTVDLSAYVGPIEVSLSYVSDDIIQLSGVFIDDIVVSTGEGTTSFEDDGDVMDGWFVPGAPEGSPGNENDWFIGTAEDGPPSLGERARMSFARQPEIIGFLEQYFGHYPFHVGGGIVDAADIGFALENQTRPIYSPLFFTDQVSGDFVVVHELAHQWVGDSLRVADWSHIWLNEGFATYAEWLWSESQGLGTVQENFDFWYELIPADDPFWQVTIGDPGAEFMFDFSVYIRGAMTLQQLRLAVGDATFFKILKSWVNAQRGDTVTTAEFIELAEKISGQELDALFQTWLFTAGRPVIEGADAMTFGAEAERSAAGSRLGHITDTRRR